MKNKNEKSSAFNSEWIGIGVAIGVALGVAFDDIAVGLAIGVAIGAGMGSFGSEKEKNQKNIPDT